MCNDEGVRNDDEMTGNFANPWMVDSWRRRNTMPSNSFVANIWLPIIVAAILHVENNFTSKQNPFCFEICGNNTTIFANCDHRR